MSDYVSQFTGPEIDSRLTKVSQLETSKQDKLVSGTNIKTVGGTSILGSGDIPIQAGDTNAVKYVSQSLTGAQKAQARSNIGAQEQLVSGTNIKTVNNQTLLGPGNITVQAGDTDAVKYVSQTLTDAQKAQARTNIGAADSADSIESVTVSVDDTSGTPEADVTFVNQELSIAFHGLKGEDGVGFDDVATQQDGTIVITLTNGDTITIDLNHNHPQYPKYEYLTSESQMPSSPDSDTLYLILETS